MLRRLRANRRGAAAIEFALVAPFIFMGIFGLIAVSIYYYQCDMLDDAMRQGARDVMINHFATSGDITAAFNARLAENGFEDIEPQVSIVSEAAGDVARILVSWTADVAIPMVDKQTLTHAVSIDIPL